MSIAEHITRLSASAGLAISESQAEAHAEYLSLLARWNKKTNLTSLPVDPPTDAAIQRLIIEPLMAADLVLEKDVVAIDLGSGGGSPALPLKVAVPRLAFTLVEMRARKCAFLREAVRQLGLERVQVAEQRFETIHPSTKSDLVTVRAVLADEQLWKVVSAILAERGRVFWFGGSAMRVPRGFSLIASRDGLVVVGR